MKPQDIQVGKIYRGGPYAHPRRVLSISADEVEFELVIEGTNRWRTPERVGHHTHKMSLIKEGKLTNQLRSFANWVKEEMNEE